MKRIGLLVLMQLFIADAYAWKISCNPNASNQYCYSWFEHKNRATGETKRYKINFKISQGEVDTGSVCSEQGYGSIDSITCKREASELFSEACRVDGGNSSLSSSRKRLYCDAFRRFVPSR